MKHIHKLCFFALILSCASVLVAQQKMLSIDDIYDPQARVNFNGTPAMGQRWLKDGVSYLQGSGGFGRRPGGAGGAAAGGQILKVNAVSGESAPFFDAAKMEAAFAKAGLTPDDARRLSHRGFYQLNPAESATLINFANDLFYYEFGNDKAVRLTHTPDEETNEDFSPDGRSVSFVRGNNLYVVDVATQQERALTTDGGPKTLNGALDWVYEEEVYGRGNHRGYWWSPDSSRIAYLHFDETPVHEFIVVDHIPRLQTIESTAYPLAGDPNPKVELGVVPAAGGRTQFINSYTYQAADPLIVRVSWTPDSKKVVYQVQNREQTWLDLNAGDPADGSFKTLLKETSKAWVEVIDNPTWLKDGSFLWFSERTGFRHLYHYAADGKLLRPVTEGRWEARALHGVDEQNGWIYFSSDEHGAIANHLYRIHPDGTGLTRLTQTEGTHSANFNPAFTLFIDTWSDVNTPAQVRLYKSDGTLSRIIDENKVETLKQYALGKPEFLQVKTRDGFPMEAMILKPPSFDPKKKYPVMSFTYSGPHAPQVRNAWGSTTFMWYQMLAEKGYIVWVCDNRTASGKGVESTWPVYHHFGELELRDLEDGVAWLKSQPYVDGARIGISGWSYGGFMTSYALTHSKAFKVGIAGGTVSDFRLYDSVYTERYMGLPQNNVEGYAKSAPLNVAKDLSGKLLLLHGAIDDNVHIQNTIQFVYELEKAGKQFQLMVYPKSRHGVVDPVLVKQMRTLMTNFIEQNL